MDLGKDFVVRLLEECLMVGAWHEARGFAENERFKEHCQEDGGEVLNMLMQFLTADNFEACLELYNTAEFLLKATAKLGNPQDMALGFLDLLDYVEDDNVLVSLMKGLKVVLLRLPEKKALSMEMCLEALLRYFRRLPGPKHMQTSFSLEKIPFLESDKSVDRILQLHLILLLFLEPIVEQVVAERPQDYTKRTLENTRHNVLIHFLLNMLCTDLNRVYLPYDSSSETNTYVRQCRETLTKMLTELLGHDPFFLLPFVERRIRYPVADDEHALGIKKMNVFLLPDKAPLEAFGHFFHTLLIHGLAPGDTPKIYTKEFIFLRFVYLVAELMSSADENVQMKGIELGHTVLLLIEGGDAREDSLLELVVFETFFERLIRLTTYSENEHVRKHAVRYMEQVVLAFNDRGRLIILQNLFQEFAENKGLCGYLPLLYKNMVVDALNGTPDAEPLPKEYTGKVFRKMLIRFICHLPEGEKTNILDLSDRILAALNLVRFIALRDRTNRTSFWDLKGELEREFLHTLRLAIDLSRAHYKQHKKSIEIGQEGPNEQDVSLSMYDQEMPQLSREQKLIAMESCLNNIDLMDSLLARANECVQTGEEARRGQGHE